MSSDNRALASTDKETRERLAERVERAREAAEGMINSIFSQS